MIRIVTKEEVVKQDVVVEETIVCNKCERELHLIVDGRDDHDAGEFHEITLGGGSHNWVIGDFSKTTIHLCQFCVDEMLDSLRVPPVIENSIGFKSESWDEWKARRPKWRH